jgi:hypothetical protein
LHKLVQGARLRRQVFLPPFHRPAIFYLFYFAEDRKSDGASARGSRRNVNTQRHGLIPSTNGCRGELSDLAYQLLQDPIKLLYIDVDDFAVVFEVKTSVVTMEVVALYDVVAAQDAVGLVEVDIALDVRRHIIGEARGIIGNEQIHRHIRGVEMRNL